MHKWLKTLSSPFFTGLLFILFIVAMAAATFIENDFGSSSARSIIYEAKWFELIMVLMVVNLVGQIISFKLFQKKKITILIFHASFIVMIIGAAITRYIGFEGTMHIREGESSSYWLTSEKSMGFNVYGSNGEQLISASSEVEVTATSLGKFSREINLNGENVSVRYLRYIPNASETVVDMTGKPPVISLLVSHGMTSREVVSLRPGDIHRFPGLTVSFSGAEDADVKISIKDGRFIIESAFDLSEISMMTREETKFPAGSENLLNEMMIYSISDYMLVPQKFSLSGGIVPVTIQNENRQTGMDAFELEVVSGSGTEKVYVYNIYDGERTYAETFIGDHRLELFYGPERIELPFSLTLEDFILEHYPGSTSPSGYKSNVILNDVRNGTEMPYSIYMNNILKYGGYRFYQSSYDKDELGTILSVNHDRAGMSVTYFGYGLLFIFIVLSLFNKNSLFSKANPSFWRNNSSRLIMILMVIMLLPAVINATPVESRYDKKKADEFGRVLIQDQKGRTKPLYTVSNDILRKVSRKHAYGELSPMQVFLGFNTDFANWVDEPVIKVSNRELRNQLGLTSEYAALNQLIDFDNNQAYKLSGMVDEVFVKPESERSKRDKEVIKLDERVNIIIMMANGQFLKMFPLRDGTENWGLPSQALANAINAEDSLWLSTILSNYTSSLFHDTNTGDYSETDRYLNSIIEYQRQYANYDLPSESRIDAELFYYKSSIFERLFPFYASVGIVMLIFILFFIIRGLSDRKKLVKILVIHLFAGFLFHTFGLALRWYISGHSPMSNGYESLLFISWVTMLAGFIFSRKSYLTLAATAVLASLTLMVAHLSFMDPEITALVPVLQSYWLTLHVSIITASYGFLGLSAILAIIVLILYSLSSGKNRGHILKTIDDLTVINYRSQLLGLYFLTIGTFLGAVWANESWGRYWGWDPKETWSLITIMVYAFVVHSRMIKSLNSIFTFNLMSLYAFSSVLMTYFGVNYYLSGLHSYAGGDPVPVPSFVYYTIAALLLLTIMAYRKYDRLKQVIECHPE